MNLNIEKYFLTYEEKVNLLTNNVPFILNLVSSARQNNIYLTESDMEELNTDVWDVSNKLLTKQLDPKVRERILYNFSLSNINGEEYDKVIYSSKRNGILYIKNEIENLNDEFLKIAYKYYLKDHSNNLNKPILYNLIMSSSKSNVDYIKMCIQLDALSMVVDYSESYINVAIFSYFGLDFKNDYIDILKQKLPTMSKILFNNNDFNL